MVDITTELGVKLDSISLEVLVNDNDNRCISGVIGWDHGLVLSNVFVACVRQLNTFLFLFNFLSL